MSVVFSPSMIKAPPVAGAYPAHALCPIARVQQRLAAQSAHKREVQNTIDHQNRVALLSFDIATHLGVSETSRGVVFLSAKYHDIGKMDSSEQDILFSPRKLTTAEFDTVIRPHAHDSHAIISATDHPYAAMIAKIAEQHHERLDGSGYPHKTLGDEIMPEARIVAVADVYDAMIDNTRRYRNKPPATPEEAIMQLHLGAGTKYDRRVVEALTDLVLNPTPYRTMGRRIILPTPSLAFS